MVLNITVKTLDSQNYQFEAQDDWTVSQFKDHIQNTVNILPEHQRLIFCGRVLQNDKKLVEYDCHEKVMHLVRGPPPSPNLPERNEPFHNTSAPSSRFSHHDFILSTTNPGTEEQLNEAINLWRQIMLIQQTILTNNHVTGEALSTLTDSNRTGAEIDRRLSNLGRLIRMTIAQIAECNNRISQINLSVSTTPRPIITAASSHTDLPRENELQPINHRLATAPGRTSSFTNLSSTETPPAATSDAFRRQTRLVSLTTDDLPRPSAGPRLAAAFALTDILRLSRPEAYDSSATPRPGDTMLDRYVALMDHANDLQSQILTLAARYREMLMVSRRGGLIVSDRPAGVPSSQSQDPSDESTQSGQQTASSESESSTRQLSTVFMQEARILGQYIPRIMHTFSHVLHALSDFSVDVSNGTLTVPSHTMGMGFPVAGPIVRDGFRRASRRSSTQNANPQTHTSSENPGRQFVESSVTITATTVDTAPISTTSTTTPGLQPHASATIVVTSEPGQAGLHIPISIPLGSFDQRDIHFNFSTPQVPPPTEEHSRDSSASRQRDSNPRGASDQQNSQPQRRHETASTQTSSIARPFSVITGRIPPPFDAYLMCSSPLTTYSVPSRGQMRRSLGVAPDAGVRFRPPPMGAQPGTEARVDPILANMQEHATRSNPIVTAGLSEVVNNILESIFRPTDGQPAAQSAPINASQDDQTRQSNRDPILNMIPELAINAATQMISGVLGFPTPQQQQPRTSVNSQQNQTSRPQGPVMMDIDIDDSSSSQSESRYHDANDFNRSPTVRQQVSASQQQPPSSPRPTSSRQATSSCKGPTDRQTVTSDQRIDYNREHLTEVMRNHPDWLPIIEADINFMEQQLGSGVGGPPYFSDAYLSSVPRKRRRLLTTTPERVLILQPSPSEAITNLLRRSVISSNISTDIGVLDPMLNSIANDTDLWAAYEEHIKSAVEARLRSDCDYKPENFENSRRYFSQ